MASIQVENGLKLHPARWWSQESDEVICNLCPQYCHISEGESGLCQVRVNRDNQLYSTVYGRISHFVVDPVEKKLLNHFLPGTLTLSFGTYGCNLTCFYCHAWEEPLTNMLAPANHNMKPEQVVALAQQYNCASITMTFNEPTIYGEYVINVSRIAKENGIKSIVATAGYITPEARLDLYQYIDAAVVNIKGFDAQFYREQIGGSLSVVMNTLKWLRHSSDIWLELTYLILPDANDNQEDIQRMCEWIYKDLGSHTPIHFFTYHPDYHMMEKIHTPSHLLNQARRIAHNAGLNFCYIDNVHHSKGQNTYCPSCQDMLLKRDSGNLVTNRLNNKHCPDCQAVIQGVF